MKPRLNRQRNKQARVQSGKVWRRNGPSLGTELKPAAQPRTQSRRKGLIITALIACLTFGVAWVFFELVVWARVPPELVGKWVVKEGPQEGATFDFSRGGTMRGRINAGGNEAIVKANIRVEDKIIYSTTTNPHTGRDDTMTLKIRALTARELVVEDQQGQVLKMERAD